MGACTSKSKPPNLNPYAGKEEAPTGIAPANGFRGIPARKQDDSHSGKNTLLFPFYSSSPAQFFSSKKWPAPPSSSANSSPQRLLKRPFAPPSTAKHIKALLARRYGNVRSGNMPSAAAKTDGEERKAAVVLDKNFGFSKQFASRYEVGEEVGRGHFGYTCSARIKKGDLMGQEVAVKMTTAIAIEDVRREVKMLRALTGHKNLIQFDDAFEDQDNVYIVMEMCKGGELADRIPARGGKYYKGEAKATIVQTLKVVAFCHLQGVVHRDLKPELLDQNFLFSSKDDSSLLKAVDFGLSDFVRPDEKLDDIVRSA